MTAVGAQGIRRRRRRHTPPDARATLPPGDAARVFGGFTNGAYTPAGNLERGGLFWRQLKRRRGRDWRTVVSYVMWVGAVFVILLIVLGPIVYGLWRAFH
jgi:hypothetical protein